jgi:AraC-like DNA-binding protein/mannose-6-phosphate isomerase-like protein (cupin superfamily)
MSELPKQQVGHLEERGNSMSLYIEMRTRKGNFMPNFHYHTTYELFYIKSGIANFIVGNQNYTLYEGNLLVIPPYVPHRSIYTETQETYRIELQIKDTLLNANMSRILKNLSSNPCYTLSLKYQTSVIKLFNQIKDELFSKKEFSEDFCLAYLSEFLITVYRNAVSCQASTMDHAALPQMIMEYISQNYHRNITIAELAAQFNVCDSTIYKSFKKHTGLKITDYVNFTRVMNAERLMQETDLSLTEISYRCGFNDCNYFSGVFKRYKNMTPGRFMRQKRSSRRTH